MVKMIYFTPKSTVFSDLGYKKRSKFPSVNAFDSSLPTKWNWNFEPGFIRCSMLISVLQIYLN